MFVAEVLGRVEELVGSPPLLWERLTWPAIERLHDDGEGLVVLPVGATEQHGPHLPVGTDNLIATAVCAYASAKAGVPVLPTLSYGVSVGHTSQWHGTLSLMHETLATAVREMVEWLFLKHWRKVLIVNSHFGNDATLRVAVDRLRTDHLGQLQINVLNTYQLTPAIWAYFTSDAADLHANKAETDLLLYLAPQTVNREAMVDADDEDRTGGTVFSYPVALTSTNGVTGTPSAATAERGRSLFIEMGDALARKLECARHERAPLDQEAGVSAPQLVAP